MNWCAAPFMDVKKRPLWWGQCNAVKCYKSFLSLCQKIFRQNKKDLISYFCFFSRFKSLHCSLFPNFSWCPRNQKPLLWREHFEKKRQFSKNKQTILSDWSSNKIQFWSRSFLWIQVPWRLKKPLQKRSQTYYIDIYTSRFMLIRLKALSFYVLLQGCLLLWPQN